PRSPEAVGEVHAADDAREGLALDLVLLGARDEREEHQEREARATAEGERGLRAHADQRDALGLPALAATAVQVEGHEVGGAAIDAGGALALELDAGGRAHAAPEEVRAVRVDGPDARHAP